MSRFEIECICGATLVTPLVAPVVQFDKDHAECRSATKKKATA